MTTTGRRGHPHRKRARSELGRRVRRTLAALASTAAAGVTFAAGIGAIPGIEPPTTYVTSQLEPGAMVRAGELADRSGGRARTSRASRDTAAPTPEPSETVGRTDPMTPTPDPTSPAPEPIEIPTSGSGELTVVTGHAAADDSAAQLMTYRVELEDGLPFDGVRTAAFIHDVLRDKRGWPGVTDTSFRRTEGDAELRIIIATPDLTDELCLPLDTGGELSCRIEDRVVLNAKRWAEGAPDYGDELEAYRTYLINHEVGHALGYGHADCPGAGEPAPVMMQQTKGIGECTINPWPTVATG